MEWLPVNQIAPAIRGLLAVFGDMLFSIVP
jgi:hypothetical protein